MMFALETVGQEAELDVSERKMGFPLGVIQTGIIRN